MIVFVVSWIEFQGQSHNFLYLVVVLVTARNGTTLESITKLWIVLPLHLGMEYLKIIPSSIFIDNNI